MSTYYEILQIAPTATLAEIESAYDTQYNQWRRLVTHHDPNIVNQANQTLQLLETARTTLTDPTRRALYDGEIGVGTTAGGLADPTALASVPVAQPRMPMAPPPPPPIQVPAASMAPQQIQQIQRPGLWACYKCGTDNPTGTKFCFSCSAQLVRDCPECENSSSLVATGICGICGKKYEDALNRQELRKKLVNATTEALALKTKIDESSGSNTGIGCGVILALIGFVLLSNNGLLGVIILLVGGGIAYFSYQGSASSAQNKRNLQSQYDKLISDQTKVVAELAGVTLDTLSDNSTMIAKPVAATASIVPDGRGYICSVCRGYVRSDAEICKHCQRKFF
ncbi:MAG: DnaJ domain-containing protein [Roseiflexaceae bacterium]|nr:DnaJ domain-containing protein [Roseiflexaceae bacterium]